MAAEPVPCERPDHLPRPVPGAHRQADDSHVFADASATVQAPSSRWMDRRRPLHRSSGPYA